MLALTRRLAARGRLVACPRVALNPRRLVAEAASSGGRANIARAGRSEFGPSMNVPRMNDCHTVAAVLEVHAVCSHHMRYSDLAACWNRIGKLVTYREECRSLLRCGGGALQPLMEQTARDVGQFAARPLATAAHGIAKVGSNIGWDPGRDMWAGVARRAQQVMREFNSQGLANTA